MAASARVRASIFSIAEDTWLRTVPWLSPSEWAMSAIVPPPSTSRKTSASRSVRGEEPADRASSARL